MRIKTFLAKDMREALEMVRGEMGENAVIVSRQAAKDGSILVRAATEEMEATIEDKAENAQGADDSLKPFEENYRASLVARLRTPGKEGAKRLPFERSALLTLLHRHRVRDGDAHALAEAAEKSGLPDLSLALAAALDKHMRTQPIDMHKARLLTLLGAHGAGKTTITAKLAAHGLLSHRDVQLLATDLEGAGARARLETFGQHLGVPVIAAPGARQILQLTSEAPDTLFIADSAGFDPRDQRQSHERAALVATGESIGIVSATMDAEEASEMAQALSEIGVNRIIVTGLDLARRKGALVALALSSTGFAHVTGSPFLADGLDCMTPLSLARALIAPPNP